MAGDSTSYWFMYVVVKCIQCSAPIFQGEVRVPVPILQHPCHRVRFRLSTKSQTEYSSNTQMLESDVAVILNFGGVQEWHLYNSCLRT